jgi:protoporphyrinogen oxidase
VLEQETRAAVSPWPGQSFAVLGAGLAGLAAADALRRAGQKVMVYEKADRVGGHARSHSIGGFVFDEGPHVSFTRRSEIQALFAAAVAGRYQEQEARVLNFWRGRQVPHPAQCHLHGLPADFIERTLLDFEAAQSEAGGEPGDYREWCLRNLGRAFSEEFTFPYTRKYWTTDASGLATDWIGPRIHRPSLNEVVAGAVSARPATEHYINRFRYPLFGGFGAYVAALLPPPVLHAPCERGGVCLGREVVLVDLARGRLEFADGTDAGFDRLVSSLPLPELIRRVKDAPPQVTAAAENLLCTSVMLVNLGLERDEGFPDAHWAYLCDEDRLPSRIHFPHHLSPHTAPPRCGSIQAEVYYSRHRPLPTSDVLNRTVEDLTDLGLLRRGERLRVARLHALPYANVVFDHARAINLATVRGYLDEQGVVCCGRYGEWAYYWTDDSILSGWRAAQRALAEVHRPTGVLSVEKRPGVAAA